MINTAIVSNCESGALSEAHVIDHSCLACWSLFLKNTPKYINGSKPLNKKVNPKLYLIRRSHFPHWRCRAGPRRGKWEK